ncbi:6-phosphofructokinase [bacterium]|nr:MAG: 6-phosphofructokinase [bacterium]
MATRVGILTGGGDCPGLNAVIRAAVYRGKNEYNMEFVGIRYGWKGLLEKDTIPLNIDDVRDTIAIGGTMLRTSRTNPTKTEKYIKTAIKNFRDLELDYLIAIGGEDTLGAAFKLWKIDNDFRVVGVPKTIDNDLWGTDVTFGFDTAINLAVEAIDHLHTTARSHNRVMVVELMGRHAGWITLEAGIGGGADIILIPEVPFDIEKDLCEPLRKLKAEGREYAIVAVSEGAKLKVDEDRDGSLIIQEVDRDEFGHVRLGGIAKALAEQIEDRVGWESRFVVLGHLQRGGPPSAFDRVLSTRYGIAAADAVAEGLSGVMIALKGSVVEPIEMTEEIKNIKKLPEEYRRMAKLFSPKTGK